MANARLQKQLNDNKARRNIMKEQFGQFASYPA
jgi:hypothetical protein